MLYEGVYFDAMVFLMMWNSFPQNSSLNDRYIQSFTGGVTPTLLLACVAFIGVVMLLVVCKHAYGFQVNRNVAQNLDVESSGDESLCLESVQLRNFNS